MPRFTFDVFLRKEQFILLPLNLVCRKRSGNNVETKVGEQYLITLEASSYDDAADKLMDRIRSLRES